MGGPGAGKSTTASALFAKMKRSYYNVELVTEYAKDMVWEERHKIFGEQDYITAQQNKRLRRLIGKVDFAITDSPILLGMCYIPQDYYISCFRQFIWEIFSSYNNLNFYIEREKGYVQIGRNQSASEAMEKDNLMYNVLKTYQVPFHSIAGNEHAEDDIFKVVKAYAKENGIQPVIAAKVADAKHRKQLETESPL